MTDPTFSVFTSPKVLGYWIFPGCGVGYRTQLAAYSKPSWFHQKMMKLILGFGWEDA